jgi:hypothetical protein
MRPALYYAVSISLALSWATASDTAQGIQKVRISFASPAYVGMPIWLIVESDKPNKIHYPVSTTPTDFGCNRVEVQYNGNKLIRVQLPVSGGGHSGPACGWVSAPGSPESRLPLHLQYPITEPGIYLVRYTRFEYQHGQNEDTEQSEWTPLEVRRSTPVEVSRWLASELRSGPTSPGLIVGDFLPSLLASRTRAALHAALEETYSSDEIVGMYAGNSLPLFDPQLVRQETLSVLKSEGPNDCLAYAFGSSGSILKPISEQIAAVALANLDSPTPQKVLGAVHSLVLLSDPAFGLGAGTIHNVSQSLDSSVDHVVSQRNEKAAWWLANYFGQKRTAETHQLLWKIADANLAVEQSLICITWFKNASDLPKLTTVTETYDPDDPHGYRHASIAEGIGSYGQVALPYLQRLLQNSRQTWVRTSTAKGLVSMNDPVGFQFFIAMLKDKPFYANELIGWLKETFPTLKTADDSRMMAFLEEKISHHN